MKTNVCTINFSSAPDTSASIIGRREIEPLVAKARKILKFYHEAMDCSAAVLDRNGVCIRTPEYKHQMRFCDFCKEQYRKTHSGPESAKNHEKSDHPCKEIHFEAQAESRRMDETYIYACPVGFVYWTAPLYRKGHYAGALTAGQVLSYRRSEAVENFRVICKDREILEKFSKIVEEIPEKNHEEIQAMARLLGVCAAEISEKGEDPDRMIRRLAWQKGNVKNMKDPVKPFAKRKQNSGKEADSEYPLEKERMLFAAFRRGDNETGTRILKELMGSILAAIPGNFEIIRFRAIELVVLLSRAAFAGGPANSHSGAAAGAGTAEIEGMLETNNRYLRRIQESKTPDELIENLNLIAERMASKIFSFQGVRHASVLRKAERYIWENYSRKISLEEIARASGLSAPYFSTIFKEEMGENLSGYLNRLRIEKAATLLMETAKSLNEIAGLCGFEDQSWFSKIFKSYTGMSPGKYREKGNGSRVFRTGRSPAKGDIFFPGTSAGEQSEEDILSS